MDLAAILLCEPEVCACGSFLRDRVLLLREVALICDVLCKRTARVRLFLLEGDDFVVFSTRLYCSPSTC